MKKGRISLVLGIIAGTITGLLFAPSKGKELRNKIAKEREGGGLGHKVVGEELNKMADDISNLVKTVARSEEAKRFWQKTNSTVADLTEGKVELDEWVKEAHKKADMLKKAASKFAEEKKKYLEQASGAAKKAKSTLKKVGKKVSTIKKTTPKKKAAPKKKAVSKKKTAKKNKKK